MGGDPSEKAVIRSPFSGRIQVGIGTSGGPGSRTQRLRARAVARSASAERSTGAVMHLHPLWVDFFSGQQDLALAVWCISQVESQLAATHADMGIEGVDRLNTTRTAPIRRIIRRASSNHDMPVV